MESLEAKTVFISYSWTSDNHVNWVVQLASRLIGDGVDVKLDKWDLREGQDKFVFMESMVTSPDIDKVLIILDKKYAEKADERQGGVGTETMIITPKVYGDANQSKFIPIVTELDDKKNGYLPSYLAGRIYIDFSTSADIEKNYEQLLRNIYNRPSLAKPKLGKAPRYLTEDTPIQFKTTTIVRGFDAQINSNPNRINSILLDFTEEYFNNLSEFVLSDEIPRILEDVGQAVLSILHQYQPLRNDYSEILDKALKSGLVFDAEIFFRLLEKIPILLQPLDPHKQSWEPFRYDHFNLIIHELFLCTVAVGLKNYSYAFLEQLLHQRYLIQEGRNRVRQTQSFTAFLYHYNVIDDYYKKLKNRDFFSVQADILVSQTSGIISKELLIKSDMLCHYVAKLNNDSWFPMTYIYGDSYRLSFDFFAKLVSKNHFEKIKKVLGFESLEEIKDRIRALNQEKDDRGYGRSSSSIPSLSDLINVDMIGSSR